jgi:N-acetylneuraminate synthase
MIKIKIGNNIISNKHPAYFIADIASNHDGSLKRAKKLIKMAADSGANAAKFQNFYAKTLVSDYGFKNLANINSHQNKWGKSVYKTYEENEVPIEWTQELKEECKNNNIEYFTAPYDLKIISYLNQYVDIWKLGSGDITWHENILQIAKTKKPLIIATGASNLNEVKKIYNKISKINNKICIMQCNTNYTGLKENFKYINLNVLKSYKKYFPKAILGLSDHTIGHETVLGAITLGAKVIEKHFTDNNNKTGPDHEFSMNPKSWEKMIDASRNLELSLGSELKKLEKNEEYTVILQRRSARLKKNIKTGEKITSEDIEFLRPCPKNAAPIYNINKIYNKISTINLHKNNYITKNQFKKILSKK